MTRREFITLLGGAAAAWPLAGRAQSERMRRIGVLTPFAADDSESMARIAAFLQGLGELGWAVGRNVRIDYRWSAGDPDLTRKAATELVALAPDVILATGTPVTAALQQASLSVPIVFAQVPDPVANGFVAGLARPGGNTTGFTTYDYAGSAKWVEVLKEIAPGVTRAAVLRDPTIASGIGQLGAVLAVAPSLGIEMSPIGVRDASEIEGAVTAFAREPRGGLIPAPDAFINTRRHLIMALAERHRLPAIYGFRQFVTEGALMSYGPDAADIVRRSTSYVDRILKGERPTALPVQAPTKYELVINLKTARTFGLEVSPMLLALADEVIE